MQLDTSLGRPLSAVERFHWISDRISPLSVIVRARVRGALPEPLLRRALDALAERHAFLRVAVAAEDERTQPRFVPTEEPIPLRCERLTPDGDEGPRWVRELNERELVERIDWQKGPLLRALVLSHGDDAHDVLLTIAHCIADGKTALSLLQQWFELAHGLLRGAPPAGTRGPLLSPPDEMLPWQHRGWVAEARFAASSIVARHVRKGPRPNRFVPTRQVPFEQRRTGLLHRSLAPAQLHAVVRACRRERTTVNGALAAALVSAVARDANHTERARFSVGSPIDCRDELVPRVPHDAVGSYVATIPSVVEWRPGAPLWPMARAIRRQVLFAKWSGAHLAAIHTLNKVGPKSMADSQPFWEGMEAFGPINLCISNLGCQDFPASIGPWQISGAQLAGGLSANGYLVGVANTSHGHMFWNFAYVRHAIPEERVRRIADDCIGILLSAT